MASAPKPGLKFISRARTSRPMTYNYVYECTCRSGKVHRLEFATTEARVEAEATRLCDEHCSED